MGQEFERKLDEAKYDLYEALKELLEHYLSLANSGDAGFWNPEEEEQVINARKALAKVGK